MSETTRPAARGLFRELSAWLRSSDAYDVVDDAVLGCLADSTVQELFGDFEIEDTRIARRWFALELNAALREGC